MVLLKNCTHYVSKFGKLSSDHRTEKGQFSSQCQRRAMPKNVQTTLQLHSFHIIARWCSKSFKLGFSSTRTMNFQMYKLDLEKAEEPEIKLPTFIESMGSLMCCSPWGCKSKSRLSGWTITAKWHLHIWGHWHFSQQYWFQLVIHPAWHFTWCTLHIS